MAMNEIETLNMRSATLERVVKQIRDQLEDEDYTPISIIGKSGIGKTESISDLAKELGIGFKEIRLSHYQESDLVGLPYIENNVTKHAASDILPPTDDPGQGILLLDEVTSSSKSMRSAVYQLMDSSRKLGQYKMPAKWLIVACGNGPNDGGDFRGIEAAFMSRGFCWRVEPNLQIWRQWALKHGVHPVVIAYLSFMPDKLHCMDIDKPNDMIACPRNWTKLSTQLTNMEKRLPGNVITDDEDLEFAAAGCVGASEGPSFAAFYKYKSETISAQDIIAGKIKPEQMRNVKDEILYITAQSLVHLVANDIAEHQTDGTPGVTADCLKRVTNMMSWCVGLPKAGVRVDVAITIIMDLCSAIGSAITPIIMSEEMDEACPEFLQFCQDNSVVINQM